MLYIVAGEILANLFNTAYKRLFNFDFLIVAKHPCFLHDSASQLSFKILVGDSEKNQTSVFCDTWL